MPDYDKGRIYKIVSDSTKDVYVGSTIISLSKRFSTHNAATENGYNKCQSKEIIKHGDAQCILIEAYPCKSKEELHAREYHHIKKLKEEGVNVINIYMPTRTKREYEQDNPDKKKAWDAKYREKHYEELHEKAQKYNVQFTCECGSTIAVLHKNRHNKTLKHQEYLKTNNT